MYKNFNLLSLLNKIFLSFLLPIFSHSCEDVESGLGLLSADGRPGIVGGSGSHDEG